MTFFTCVGIAACILLAFRFITWLFQSLWFATVVTIMEVWMSPPPEHSREHFTKFHQKLHISLYVFCHELNHYVTSISTIVAVTKNGWTFEPPFKFYREKTPKQSPEE